ncbi:MAG: outer membrane beta-barrel protein [Bacteroidales bacterium]|nr:outer membrane beta-barrel protein [Bacteroidales bacterium]
MKTDRFFNIFSTRISKKAIFLLIGVVSFQYAMSQAQSSYWEIGLMGGISNYVGDINSMFKNGKDDSKEWNQFESSFNFYNAHFVGGVIARYNFNPRWVLRSSLLFSKLSGDDKHFNNERNLNFRSTLQELSLAMEFNFMDYRTGSRQHRFTPYIFGGVALFHFNPKTEIYDPIEQETLTVSLHDLNTEGQGLIDKRNNYSRINLSVPFGVGLKFSLSTHTCLGLEWGFRKTFTDYIDDISTTYVDRETLLAYGGEQAVTAADRTNELFGNEGLYHTNGEMRGNRTTKDWYNFLTISITTRLSSNSRGKCLTNNKR